jgi:hypothetical protein
MQGEDETLNSPEGLIRKVAVSAFQLSTLTLILSFQGEWINPAPAPAMRGRGGVWGKSCR